MKVKRRAHPDTVPGKRFIVHADGSRVRDNSVPMGTNKGKGRVNK